MRVREIMTGRNDLVTVAPGESVAQTVALLMTHAIGALPVVADRAPLGIVAERDLVRALHQNPDRVLGLPVERVMRKPPPTCRGDDDVAEVMSRMTRERARHLLVLDDGALVGVISVGDLLSQRVRELELEAGVLRDVVAAQRSRVP